MQNRRGIVARGIVWSFLAVALSAGGCGSSSKSVGPGDQTGGSGGDDTAGAGGESGQGGGGGTSSGGTGGGAGQGTNPDAHDGVTAPDADSITEDAAIDAGPIADVAPARADGAPNAAGAVVWHIDNTTSIGGHPTMVLGAPKVIDTPAGKALQFDGQKDALFVENLPVAGMTQFTVEIIMRPDGDGAEAQRYFHMSESPDDHRVLFETRVMNGKFFADVVLDSAAGSTLLYKETALHPTDAWYAIAVVYDGTRGHTYVDGVEQFVANAPWKPLGSGRTAIGMRINEKYFFKGAIRLARFTPRPLMPSELLTKDAQP